jgi:hypothetical protein
MLCSPPCPSWVDSAADAHGAHRRSRRLLPAGARIPASCQGRTWSPTLLGRRTPTDAAMRRDGEGWMVATGGRGLQLQPSPLPSSLSFSTVRCDLEASDLYLVSVVPRLHPSRTFSFYLSSCIPTIPSFAHLRSDPPPLCLSTIHFSFLFLSTS